VVVEQEEIPDILEALEVALLELIHLRVLEQLDRVTTGLLVITEYMVALLVIVVEVVVQELLVVLRTM
jgi:hypothetical protein